jgi:hypothetical protein
VIGLLTLSDTTVFIPPAADLETSVAGIVLTQVHPVGVKVVR